MKKFVCCLFITAIVIITAGAQELLVQESSFYVVPVTGQSEIIINFVGSQSVLVSINGTTTMQLMPGEITKVVVNNGNISIGAETYYYTPKTGWARWGKAALFELDTSAQSVIIQISNRINGNITITQMKAKPLQIDGQTPSVYNDSNIEDDVN
jgi:hypothetical protein